MSPIAWKVSDGVCEVTLTRPEKLNAISLEMTQGLLDVQRRVREDRDVKAVLVWGEGESFCAGADLEHIARVYRDLPEARTYLNTLRDVIVGFERLPQPVIGAVHGHVLAGGVELMMGFDLVVADAAARIGDQHMRRGFIPGGGNTQRFPTRMGKMQALDLLLTGRWVSADEAERLGLVSRVAPVGESLAVARQVAAELAAKPREALIQVKRLTHLAYSVPLADGLEVEIEEVMRFYSDPGFVEALESFIGRTR